VQVIAGVPKLTEEAVRRLPGLVGGVNIVSGKITCEAVAAVHGIPYSPFIP